MACVIADRPRLQKNKAGSRTLPEVGVRGALPLLCPAGFETGLGVLLCQKKTQLELMLKCGQGTTTRLCIITTAHIDSYQSFCTIRQHHTGQRDADRKFTGMHSAEGDAYW